MPPIDAHDLHARLSVQEDRMGQLMPKVDAIASDVGAIRLMLAKSPEKRHPLAFSAKELIQLGVLLGALIGGVLWAKPGHSELKQVVREFAAETAEAK